MKHRVVLALLVVVSSLAFANAPRNVADLEGLCQVTVPADWQVMRSVQPFYEWLLVSNGHMTMTVNSARITLDTAKELAKPIYKNPKITKDTADEFEMEVTPNQIFRAIPAGSKGICSAQVSYSPGSIDDARKVVRTLARKQ